MYICIYVYINVYISSLLLRCVLKDKYEYTQCDAPQVYAFYTKRHEQEQNRDEAHE